MRQLRPILLVIDYSPATAAVVNSALKNSPIEAVLIKRGEDPLKTIKKLSPFAIICADDIPGLSPAKLIEKIRAEKELEQVYSCILLDKGEAKKDAADLVISKPLSPEDINLLLLEAKKKDQHPSVLVYSTNDTFSKLLRIYLKKHHIEITVVSSAAEIQEGEYLAAIAMVNKLSELENLKWFKPNKMKHLVCFHNENERPKAPSSVTFVKRPVSEQKLYLSICEVLDLEENPEKRLITLTKEDQALLAAKASALAYERLLTSHHLREGNWEEAANAALESVLETCQKFETLISGIKKTN